jgi:hypothetical protein
MVKASNVEIPEEDMLDNTTRELRSFRSAATKYLQGYDHYKRIKDDALQLKQLDPFIGTLELKQVHMGSLQDFIAKRRQDGVKTNTLNMALAVVRRVLNLTSSEWMDRQDKTWHRRSNCFRSRTPGYPTRTPARNRRSCFKSCPTTSHAWRSSR